LETIVDRIARLYARTKSGVKTKMGMIESFTIESGLRQGGVLSPLLFITVMNEIQKRVEHQLGKENMKLMLFAGENKQEVQDEINERTKVAKEYGLNFSAEKSEIVILMERNNRESSVTMDGHHLKKVDRSIQIFGQYDIKGRSDGQRDQ
jgi:Reverse transcriptase (RNA-dependent DNA polymerase).